MELEELRRRALELLSYNPETGSLTWITRPSPHSSFSLIGSPAGHVSRTGYYYVRFDKQVFLVSRLVFLMHYGRWPEGRLKYKNGEVLDTRISNLEEFDLGVKWEDTPEGKAAYLKAYRNKYSREVKRLDLNKTFGMSLEQYESLAEAQGFVCSICKQPETERREGKLKALAVDHDHQTDEIRGLLCGSCNKMLGFAKEDLSILDAAMDYLQNCKRVKADNSAKAESNDSTNVILFDLDFDFKMTS